MPTAPYGNVMQSLRAKISSSSATFTGLALAITRPCMSSQRWSRTGRAPWTGGFISVILGLQLLHEADPCCFHGCGRHRRIQEYGDFVRARSAGHFRTVVTEGNLHLVNPREKIIIGTLLYKMARGQAVTAADLLTPFDLLREVDAIYS
ncbi:unnamed protein product [Durusdinium trenchii]|uniref:Uncharacterized protein n=1 Tax=Durusdinium trenchii TaxID=1381693 RepID=A0ABP0P7I8_9DINO